MDRILDAIDRGERKRAQIEDAPPPPDALRWRLEAIADLLPRRREFPTLSLFGEDLVDVLVAIGGAMTITTYCAREASLDGADTVIAADLDVGTLRVSAIHTREATEDERASLEAHGSHGTLTIAEPIRRWK
jgi:hypothetical protein